MGKLLQDHVDINSSCEHLWRYQCICCWVYQPCKKTQELEAEEPQFLAAGAGQSCGAAGREQICLCPPAGPAPLLPPSWGAAPGGPQPPAAQPPRCPRPRYRCVLGATVPACGNAVVPCSPALCVPSRDGSALTQRDVGGIRLLWQDPGGGESTGAGVCFRITESTASSRSSALPGSPSHDPRRHKAL